MARIECPYEADVLTMATTGRWPERAPADLVAHAATCGVCADLARVAVAIDEERDSRMSPSLPGSGTVWWRAQLRARQEAVKDVGRPITVAQAALLAVVGGVAGAVFGATSDWLQQGIRRGWSVVTHSVASFHLPAPSLGSTDPSGAITGYGVGLLVAAFGIAAALAVVVWALREE